MTDQIPTPVQAISGILAILMSKSTKLQATRDVIALLVGRQWSTWKVYAWKKKVSPFDTDLIRDEMMKKYMGS